MIAPIVKDAQSRMGKSQDALSSDLVRLRTGRASVAIVDHLRVTFYGSLVPLTLVASVAVADARSIVITPWDKAMVSVIEKAIFASDLGITPNTVGSVIRLNLPPLTQERREELSRHVHGEGEKAKVAIRNIRRAAIESVKALLKDKVISEDQACSGEKEIQKITDLVIKKVDEVVKSKQQELMAV